MNLKHKFTLLRGKKQQQKTRQIFNKLRFKEERKINSVGISECVGKSKSKERWNY